MQSGIITAGIVVGAALVVVAGAAVVPVRNQMVFINIFKTFKMHLVGYLYIHWHISSPH